MNNQKNIDLVFELSLNIELSFCLKPSFCYFSLCLCVFLAQFISIVSVLVTAFCKNS